MTQQQKLILAILLFAATGYVVYSNFFASGNSGSSASTMATTTEGQDIIDLSNELNSISINPALFSSPLFESLKDSDIPVSPEIQGRPNPFEIIGVDNEGQNTVSISTTTKK